MSSDLFSYRFRTIALKHLSNALGVKNPEFKEGQLEAILSIVQDRKKLLLVQRTGWGKSMVYFIATKILRDPEYYDSHLRVKNKKPGPALMISPLLSLMRNQVFHGSSLVKIGRLDSSITKLEKDEVINDFINSDLDLLVTTPEQLANEQFREEVLMPKSSEISLLIIDEAHCISDWGHDFRPDYMRVKSIISGLPLQTPVIATTATANERVVEDIEKQMGESVHISRGKLTRRSLHLQTKDMPSQEERLAFLVESIIQMGSSGIVYVSTTSAVTKVTNWLLLNNIKAVPYSGRSSPKIREETEKKFLNDEIKVVVATNALGMGFDKPNLGFVIHYNTPQSAIHYYQQVGRAGRALEDAFGICLLGAEDEVINNYFIEKAFPKMPAFKSVIDCLEKADRPMKEYEMTFKCNISTGHLEKLLKILGSLESAPILKDSENRWVRTANPLQIDWEKVEEIEEQRFLEWDSMKEYINSQSCLMQFLAKNLSDNTAKKCGRCSNCNPLSILELKNKDLLIKASKYLKRTNVLIKPRKSWIHDYSFQAWPQFKGNISEDQKLEEGKALCFLSDSVYGPRIFKGKKDLVFDDELIRASIDEVLKADNWIYKNKISHITCVPSLEKPSLVPIFAKKLAFDLNLPFINCVSKIKENKPQKLMQNSFYQKRNLDGAFSVDLNEVTNNSNILLIDDIVDSRWTLTIIGALLKEAGADKVFPFCLANQVNINK